jgi:hypothetical protein
MPMQWPVGKIDIINWALVLTRNNLVAVAEDGSTEWLIGSAAYESAISVMMEEYGWGFATKVAVLTPSPTAPSDTYWDTAYPLPQDLMHLVWVKQGTNTQFTQILTVWDIQLVGDPNPVPMLLLRLRGSSDVATIRYTSWDGAASDAQSGTPLFVQALREFVLSGIYRGLNNDNSEADKIWLKAENTAQRSRNVYTQQKPRRQLFNSRISAVRRGRNPWPTGPDGWNCW